MKVYSIIITVAAVCALGLAGYFYWQGGDLRKDFGVCQDKMEGLVKDKARLEGEVGAVSSQLAEIGHSAVALKTAINSFMYPGDIRALAVGQKEAAEVEKALENIDDSQDRMMAEKDWGDFKASRYFNPLFGLLRGLVNNIAKNATMIAPPF